MPYKKMKERMICANCADWYIGSPNSKFCSSECKNEFQKKRTKKVDFNICTGNIGALSELIVSAELIKKGFDVFRALSPATYADIVAVKNSSFYLIEVRTGVYYHASNGEIKLNYPPKKINDKNLIIVTHVDNKIHYINCETIFN